jgi:hypothetical protein
MFAANRPADRPAQELIAAGWGMIPWGKQFSVGVF